MEEKKSTEYYKWLKYVYSGEYFKVDKKILPYFISDKKGEFRRLVGLYRLYSRKDGRLITVDFLPKNLSGFGWTAEKISLHPKDEYLYIYLYTRDPAFQQSVNEIAHKKDDEIFIFREDIGNLIRVIRKHRPIRDTRELMKKYIESILQKEALYDENLIPMILDYAGGFPVARGIKPRELQNDEDSYSQID